LAAIDWASVVRALDQEGWARTPPLLSPSECAELAGLYGDESRFRSRIEMARYRFGEGEYKYFRYPLPATVEALRTGLYPRLAGVANRWQEQLGAAASYPTTLEQYLRECHEAGQSKPTPLLLRYEAGGYNCLHQDLYGDLAFPLQATCFLSRPGADYTGGNFLLVEQRPRAQSRGEAIRGEQGELVIFPTRYRPVRGARGYYRVVMRHGVSTVWSGIRYTLGLIFHDAR
jgi:hypothetical protein